MDPVAAALLGEPGTALCNSAIDKELGCAPTKALSISRKHGHPRAALELFSGCGQLPKALNKRGFGHVPIDMKCFLAFDLTHKNVLRKILGWITGRCVVGLARYSMQQLEARSL